MPIPHQPLIPLPPPERRCIATVTLNPAFDRTLSLPAFRPNALNRAERVTLQASGKGVNVARTLAALGVPTLCLGIVAGESGRMFRAWLDREGLPTDFVEASNGETRTNLTLLVAGRRTEIKVNEPGPVVVPAVLDRLATQVTAAARRSYIVVFSGSLPPGAPADIYRHLILVAQEAGALAVLDAEGEPLRHGLAARPFLVKPNRHEAEQLLGRRLRTIRAAAEATNELAQTGTTVLLTLGSRGALLATPTARWHVSAPHVRANNTVGAGDAFLAGFLASLYQGYPTTEAIQRAASVALRHLIGPSAVPLPSPRVRPC